ncbi:MAG: hypothetical protein ACK4FL_03680 [Microgenomates group bacterium]
MTSKNFTPIDNLIKKYKAQLVSQPKEVEPLAAQPEVGKIKEVIEYEIKDEEVKPFVSPRAETIKLPPDLKKLGLQPASTTKFPTYQNIKLPISDDKIIAGLHRPVTDSLRWLATLAVYLLKMAHLQLKVVHGKVVRVIRG